MKINEHKWLVEYTSGDLGHMIGIADYIKCFKSRYQQIEIADTCTFGRILILDGQIQSAACDEYIYHEALVHPAMLCCPSPKNVLIIGGGEGATLREVFKHKQVEKVTMVDLDSEVVALCQKFLPQWHRGSFQDPRLELIHVDARAYLEKSLEKFDVIISDVTEPVEEGPSTKLFTLQYYRMICERLNTGGIIALQAGDFSLPHLQFHAAIYNTIRQVMPFVRSYHTHIPSFNADWGYIIASPELRNLPDPQIFDQLISERELELDYFDGITAMGLFSLSKPQRAVLERETRVIDDEHLFII